MATRKLVSSRRRRGTVPRYVIETDRGSVPRARLLDDKGVSGVSEQAWEEVLRQTCRNPHQLARAGLVKDLFPFESPGILGSCGSDTARERFEDEGAREACFDFIRSSSFRNPEEVYPRTTAPNWALGDGYKNMKERIEALIAKRNKKKR